MFSISTKYLFSLSYDVVGGIFMDLIKTCRNSTKMHLLCKDHVPNFAMKNEFQTITFSLKMNHLEIHEEEFYGYVMEDGGTFLCVNVTITNLMKETLPFQKSDFVITYDSEGPYEAEEYFGVDAQFEDEWELKPNETKTGVFVYTISKYAKKIAFKYFELYDDQRIKEYRLRYIISQ